MNVGWNIYAMILVMLFRSGFWLERNTKVFHGELNSDLSALLARWALTDSTARYLAAGDLQKELADQMGYEVCPVCGWAIDGALPVDKRPLCLPHPDCEEKSRKLDPTRTSFSSYLPPEN
ncbi:MAG TPA: hypothetical protein P5080_03370 [Candidatus Paceibacterota bacterium]|nr:hypothetical protein [Candidatus Pacearchaeota archaeon]HRZ51008.1 hypothetical protein [Candidatus Paceibacterota bacterium]HSA36729.1 hypothetical protein [Candidatus Paceibacterota bacterium]